MEFVVFTSSFDYSRAILAYLVDKFAPGSPLYPKDVAARAKVDQLLLFDIGTVYKAAGNYLVSSR